MSGKMKLVATKNWKINMVTLGRFLISLIQNEIDAAMFISKQEIQEIPPGMAALQKKICLGNPMHV